MVIALSFRIRANRSRWHLHTLLNASAAFDSPLRKPLMIAGLGRKSVACVLLLCLGQRDFPVDTNVGRISARLGWIPLDAEQALEVSWLVTYIY